MLLHKNKTTLLYSTSILLALIFSLIYLTGAFTHIQLRLTDTLYGGHEPYPDIIILAIDDKSLQEIGRWPWDRTIFAQLIPKLSTAKAIGIDVAFFEPSNSQSDTELAASMTNLPLIIPLEFTQFSTINNHVEGTEYLQPIPELNQTRTGYINIITDNDGITRAVNLDVSNQHQSFTEQLYTLITNKQLMHKPTRYLINYAGPPTTFPTHSISDVLSGNIPEKKFDNKIILIGATAPDLHDTYFVPTSHGTPMPGVEIHANILHTILTNKTLTTQPPTLVILSLFFTALLISTLLHYFRTRTATGIIILLIITYLIKTIILFEKGIILDLVFFPLTTIFTYLGNITVLYLTERSTTRAIKEAFDKYVSPAILAKILQNPDQLKLGGEERDITLFFSDIRGFTSISEKLTAPQLVELINEYLTYMTDIIMNNQGYVDKYIGDAIMAFWNAPLDDKHHAHHACTSALNMRNKLIELSKSLKERNLPPIANGAGIHTGTAVVGNMGSRKRLNYTAMGDNVNLASRLEGITKQYGVNIIVSETTHTLVKNEFTCRELDAVKVKGKKVPIKIFELIEKKENTDKQTTENIKNYEKALHHYKKQQWKQASTLFSKLNDYSSKIMLERTKEYQKTPPTIDWDGTYEMKTK